MPLDFLFDIGNVILKFDFSIAADRIAGRCEISAAEILPSLDPYKNDLESGAMPAEDFVATALETLRFDGTADEFVASFVDIFEENLPVVELIGQLKGAGHRLFLLSNTNGLHVPFFTRTYRVFDHFDGAVYSHEERCMKPEAKIFEAAIARFNLDPAATVYLDDLPANVEAASRLGLKGIVYDFRRHADCLRELESAGLNGSSLPG